MALSSILIGQIMTCEPGMKSDWIFSLSKFNAIWTIGSNIFGNNLCYRGIIYVSDSKLWEFGHYSDLIHLHHQLQTSMFQNDKVSFVTVHYQDAVELAVE